MLPGGGGEAGMGPGRQAGWVCGHEAVKHSEVREVPETGARLGGQQGEHGWPPELTRLCTDKNRSQQAAG